ncbi:putative baseplate assembly protein [Enterovibrio coralii]|uniref:Baseplate protein J-like domain-containing protein n=1 Tax=Enterovibrio coralii TaxID=294935 RepID=A0A135IC46_9GAMM|nr:putative baseplate assembly protein [Enterovibrio coralii]KXF83030.1 hypothetical protein ATN88_04660 [Enterovibrio coralii]
MSNNESHCGACTGTAVLTPKAPQNAPGLTRISYRSGEYHDFFSSMTARLSSSQFGALGTLTSRDSGDFTLALIDAWSASCDVLTFYNEMWLNEAYVNTAMETGSLHELATLIDYVPHPGAAATADLAFTIAAGEGIPEEITVPAGTKVQSTPGQDEKPVIYETLDDLSARAAWNAIRPKLTHSHPLMPTTTRIPLPGTNLNLKPGDAVYFVADNGTQVFATINAVTPVLADIANDPDAEDLTWLQVSTLASEPLVSPASGSVGTVTTVFADTLHEHIGKTLVAGDLANTLSDEALSEKAFFSPILAGSQEVRQVQVFRAKAAIFGHTAPPLDTLHYSLTGTSPVFTKSGSDVIVEDVTTGPYAGRTASTWADAGSLELMDEDSQHHVYLERAVTEIGKGSTVVLIDGDNWSRYSVNDTSDISAAFFSVTGKSSRLTLNSDAHFDTFTVRGTTVFGASEWLTITKPPIMDPLDETSTSLDLHGWYPGLEAGRKVILSGLAAGLGEEPVIATRIIQSVSHALTAEGGTTVTFSETLSAPYLPQSLRIAANVAHATQGESVVEVMGDGNATPHLSFTSKQAPQTFVPAKTATGVKPTMEIRVNKILWKQVPNFLNSSPTDRVYTLRIDESGYSHVSFGDGVLGAMPRKGQQNIRASYRKTLGLEGRVKAGQLNLLMSQPLGVEAVKNLLAAEGGANPESGDEMRISAPLSCRTLGRVVSLTDYADFARAFGGIAKATSQWLHSSKGPQVIVTVAAEDGVQVPEGSDLHNTLTDALIAAGDPFARFTLRSFRQTFFRLGVKLKVHPDYLSDDVKVRAEAMLREQLSFEARDFGQPVFASEIIALLHDVDGVDAVVIERLYTGTTPSRSDGIAASMAENLSGDVVGASILSLHPGALDYLETSL